MGEVIGEERVCRENGYIGGFFIEGFFNFDCYLYF